jgi:hypothetical protein
LLNNWLLQDLGNLGTASKPLFFTPNFDISKQIGFNAYELYAPKKSEIKYYNTRSPYTNLLYVQGFKGFTQLEFKHSQNINSRLNFTLDVVKFGSSKQYDAQSSEDKLVDHWKYNISTNYISKNTKYEFLGLFYHFNHLQNEQGGIQEQSNLSIQPKDLLANYRSNYQSQLELGASSRERWNNLHIYHQYKLKNGFQAYHILDINRQKYFFTDVKFQLNKEAQVYNLPASEYLEDTLRSFLFFRTFQNQFGFKGRYKGFDYRLYGKHRLYGTRSIYQETYPNNLKSEIFIGGQAAYYLKDSTNNLLVQTEFSSNLGYYVSGKLQFKNLEAEFYQSFQPTTVFFDNYFNPVLNWQNNFSNPFVTYLSGSYKLKFKGLFFKPTLTNTIYNNYLYLDENLTPKQSGAFTVLNIQTVLGFERKRVKFTNLSIFSLNSGSDFFRIPTFINNTNLEFLITYASRLDIYVGLDAYFKSAYLADAYSPILQQFYLQNDFKVWGFPVVEPYMAFKISRVRLAFKFGYVNQGFPTQGYFTTPYYLAMPRAFQIKVNWPLFD